jgi:hypothetical protein
LPCCATGPLGHLGTPPRLLDGQDKCCTLNQRPVNVRLSQVCILEMCPEIRVISHYATSGTDRTAAPSCLDRFASCYAELARQTHLDGTARLISLFSVTIECRAAIALCSIPSSASSVAPSGATVWLLYDTIAPARMPAQLLCICAIWQQPAPRMPTPGLPLLECGRWLQMRPCNGGPMLASGRLMSCGGHSG